MKDRGLITMSLREADRFKVIQATAEGLLPQWRTARRDFCHGSADSPVIGSFPECWRLRRGH
ncbi:hypothetical protein CBA19C6_28465 [Cupriavidus pauculus]|nr:hypothetical protein CBA19C6_28465 [Cupriavidus pauculus]